MRRAVELPNVHYIALVFQDSSFVVVHVEVVRSREDRHDRWEACAFRLPIHAIPFDSLHKYE